MTLVYWYDHRLLPRGTLHGQIVRGGKSLGNRSVRSLSYAFPLPEGIRSTALSKAIEKLSSTVIGQRMTACVYRETTEICFSKFMRGNQRFSNQKTSELGFFQQPFVGSGIDGADRPVSPFR